MKKQQASERSNAAPNARAKVRGAEPVFSVPAPEDLAREIDRLLHSGNVKLVSRIFRALLDATAELQKRLASREAAVIDAWNQVSEVQGLEPRLFEYALATLCEYAKTGVAEKRRRSSLRDKAAGRTEAERGNLKMRLGAAFKMARHFNPKQSARSLAREIAEAHNRWLRGQSNARYRDGKVVGAISPSTVLRAAGLKK